MRTIRKVPWELVAIVAVVLIAAVVAQLAKPGEAQWIDKLHAS